MKPVQHLALYAAWFFSSALSVADWLMLRSALTAVAAAITKSVSMEAQVERGWYLHWTLPAVDMFALVILGIIGMVSIMGFEYLYRSGIQKGKMKKRFGIVTGIQAGLLAISAITIAIVSRLV
jgi:hypothetical protein